MTQQQFNYQARMQRIYDAICKQTRKHRVPMYYFLDTLTDLQLNDLYKRLTGCSQRTYKCFKSFNREIRLDAVKRMLVKLSQPITYVREHTQVKCFVGQTRVTPAQFVAIAKKTDASFISKYCNN